MSHRILVTGAQGQLGRSLAELDWPGSVELDLVGSRALDVSDEGAVAQRLSGGRYGAVINAAAYTAVDRAESDPVAAFRVNALAPAILARHAADAVIPLIHVSTDYVFDGQGEGFYHEEDRTEPLGVYGASKLAGELAVRSIYPRSTIIRTAWLFSPFGANFVKTMLRLGAERNELRVVDDQIGSPTSAADLAQAIQVILLTQLRRGDCPAGIYHFVNSGVTSWCRFAREILAQASERGLGMARVTAIATADYPTPARRPANSRLSTDKIGRDYGVTPRPWQEALAEVVAELVPLAEEQKS